MPPSPMGPQTPSGGLLSKEPHLHGTHTPRVPSMHLEAPHTPHTPRAPSVQLGLQLQLPPALPGDGRPAAAEAAPWREEVEALQAQVKALIDMFHDQGQSLAMEAQERAELTKLLEEERERRARDVQELRQALETEREARARDKLELAEALQAEIDARTRDVRELAKSLQSECNARAGEVEQLARMFQSEREARVQDAEDLAEALRAELSGGQAAGQEAGRGAARAPGAEAGQAVQELRSETSEIAQRLNELTQFVLSEHEARCGGAQAQEQRYAQHGAGR